MTTKVSSLGIRNIGLFLMGILFFVIGLVASFYSNPSYPDFSRTEYPYQSIGVLLVVAGIVFIALGFLLPQRIMQKISPPQ
jgi:drug/metabolite transporter (DMT)-like permease